MKTFLYKLMNNLINESINQSNLFLRVTQFRRTWMYDLIEKKKEQKRKRKKWIGEISQSLKDSLITIIIIMIIIPPT